MNGMKTVYMHLGYEFMYSLNEASYMCMTANWKPLGLPAVSAYSMTLSSRLMMKSFGSKHQPQWSGHDENVSTSRACEILIIAYCRYVVISVTVFF